MSDNEKDNPVWFILRILRLLIQTDNNMPSQKIDKRTVDEFNSSPEEIVLDGISEEPEDRDRVKLNDTKYRIEEATEHFIRLDDSGPTLFTEDGWDSIESDESYVHVKLGKRFVPYVVTEVDGDTLTLRKVKLGTSVGDDGSRSKLSNGLSSVRRSLASLRDAEAALA